MDLSVRLRCHYSSIYARNMPTNVLDIFVSSGPPLKRKQRFSNIFWTFLQFTITDISLTASLLAVHWESISCMTLTEAYAHPTRGKRSKLSCLLMIYTYVAISNSPYCNSATVVTFLKFCMTGIRLRG